MVILLAMALASSALAGDPLPSGPSFRIETEMFQGNETAPVSRHKILFDAGVIYDIHENGGRWSTVFDPARGRVILLDKKMQVQTQVSTEELIRATAQLSAAAKEAGKADSLGLNAKPIPLKKEDGYAIAFGSLHYEMTTQTVSSEELAHAYHELAVWAARLNVLRRRGAPPFARLTLGELVASEGRLPLHLILTIDQGLKKERYRAHHLVVERLSELDRKAIDHVGDRLAAFKKVSFEEFPSDEP
ncbi:MAG: hypothetical protein WD119_00755 [Pirellulaceae bacterium]